MSFECRSCLTRSTGSPYYSLEPENIRSVYEMCAGSAILRDPKIPEEICENCYLFCVRLKQFCSQCKATERILMKRISIGVETYFDVSYTYQQPYIPDNIVTVDEFFDVYEVKKFNYNTISNAKLPGIEGLQKLDEIKVCRDELPLQSPQHDFAELDLGIDETENEIDAKSINDSEDDDFTWPQTIPDDVLFYVPPRIRNAADAIKPCLECNQIISLKDQKEHYARFLNEPTSEGADVPYFVCEKEDCTYTTYNKCAFTKHLHDHDNPPISKNRALCWICGQIFTNMGDHIERKHSDNFMPCKYCKKMFPSQILKLHEKRTHEAPKNTFECQICHKTMDKASRGAHLEGHIGFKKYKCQFCGVEFRQKQDLNDHIDIHTGQLRFNCRYCKESMTRMQRRFHEKVCDQNTNKATSKSSKRRRSRRKPSSTVISKTLLESDENLTENYGELLENFDIYNVSKMDESNE